MRMTCVILCMDILIDSSCEGFNNFDFKEDVIPTSICADINEMLVSRVSEKEIFEALSQMNPRKPPGIDGLPGLFYKNNWEVVGSDVLKIYDDILNGNRRVAEIMILL